MVEFTEEETEASISETTTTDTTRLKCPSCPKSFWTRYSLNKHVAQVHEKRYKKYVRIKKHVCTFEGCEKSYTTLGKLKDHETSHTGERPFECAQCRKTFGGRAQFAIHLRRYHSISIKDLEKMINL